VGAASGTFDNIAVRNAGPSTCTLSGYPEVTGLDSGQHRVVLHTRHGTMADDPQAEQRPATIDPDGVAHVILASSSACGSGTYRLIVSRVGLGVGGTELRTDFSLWAMCRVGVGPWHVDVPRLPDPTWPSHGLKATLELPDTARAGQILSYVLVLHNDTDTAVPLTPCPAYVENVQPVRGKLGAVHQLNCSVTSVPAHTAVRFAMRLAVPREQEAVPRARLTWETSPQGLQASGVVAITSAGASPADGR
jgi:hypothetical protein